MRFSAAGGAAIFAAFVLRLRGLWFGDSGFLRRGGRAAFSFFGISTLSSNTGQSERVYASRYCGRPDRSLCIDWARRGILIRAHFHPNPLCRVPLRHSNRKRTNCQPQTVIPLPWRRDCTGCFWIFAPEQAACGHSMERCRGQRVGWQRRGRLFRRTGRSWWSCWRRRIPR